MSPPEWRDTGTSRWQCSSRCLYITPSLCWCFWMCSQKRWILPRICQCDKWERQSYFHVRSLSEGLRALFLETPEMFSVAFHIHICISEVLVTCWHCDIVSLGTHPPSSEDVSLFIQGSWPVIIRLFLWWYYDIISVVICLFQFCLFQRHCLIEPRLYLVYWRRSFLYHNIKHNLTNFTL